MRGDVFLFCIRVGVFSILILTMLSVPILPTFLFLDRACPWSCVMSCVKYVYARNKLSVRGAVSYFHKWLLLNAKAEKKTCDVIVYFHHS
uniref:Uncharacterized protein n=1 Tax=Ixodes scapularis TaxID=6945 RepID=A0A4D5RDW4_IXOSC